MNWKLSFGDGRSKEKNAIHLKKIKTNKLFGGKMYLKIYIFLITSMQTNNIGKSKFPLLDRMFKIKSPPIDLNSFSSGRVKKTLLRVSMYLTETVVTCNSWIVGTALSIVLSKVLKLDSSAAI